MQWSAILVSAIASPGGARDELNLEGTNIKTAIILCGVPHDSTKRGFQSYIVTDVVGFRKGNIKWCILVTLPSEKSGF